MKLTLVIEGAKGSDIVQKIIGWMQRRQLSEIIDGAGDPGALPAALPAPSGDQADHPRPRHPGRRRGVLRSGRLRRGRLQQVHPVLPVSRSAIYTVSVSPSSFRTKISVGSNPWTPEGAEAQSGQHLRAVRRRRPRARRRHQLEPGELDQAREIAAEIVAELKT